MAEPAQRQSIVVLDPSQVPAVRELAAAHGVEVTRIPRRGIEPVATVTLVLMGTAAAVGAVLHVLEQRRGGQVIDLRPQREAIYRTPDVVYGTVIIIAEDGQVTVEVKEPDGMFGKVISTLPELLSGGTGSAEQVAQAVTETLGSAVEVETVDISSPGGGG